MIENIKKIDWELFLFINSKHNAFFDSIMYYSSEKYFWIPFYTVLIIIIIKTYKRKSILIFIFISFLITLCDQTSNLFKNYFQRLRPSHEASLSNLIHLNKAGVGGKYGFFSAHASNTFGLIVFLAMLLPYKYNYIKIVLILWGLLVTYSRVYNGVHYPTDILVGISIGAIYGYIFSILYKQINIYCYEKYR